jgi:hypothetical protein
VQEHESEKGLKLLIYIPCHTDFKMALETIATIRDQDQKRLENALANKFTIEIALSVNGASLSLEEQEVLRSASDYFSYMTEVTGGDVNISQGYIKALEIRPAYLWILSVNEFIVENGISNLLQTIDSHPQSDIFVANSRERFSTFEIENIFTGLPEGMSTGLISGVVYKYSAMKSSFSAGPRLSWTGWGQLAVIQFGCFIHGKLVLTEFPDLYLYKKPITYLQNNEKNSEYEFVRTGYAHSFFGMILLIHSAFPREARVRNAVIRSWLYTNWYKIPYFRIGTRLRYDKNSPQFDALWVETLALQVLRRSGLRARMITEVALVLKLEKFRNNSFIIQLRKHFSK